MFSTRIIAQAFHVNERKTFNEFSKRDNLIRVVYSIVDKFNNEKDDGEKKNCRLLDIMIIRFSVNYLDEKQSTLIKMSTYLFTKEK